MTCTIIAFAFGNRDSTDGSSQTPGPVNEALAAVVAEVLERHSGGGASLAGAEPVSVWAQWEVAQVLAEDYQLGPEIVSAVCPSNKPDGEVVYLSTRGVARMIVASCGGAAVLGRTVVVAHRDHVDRCLRACRQVGIEATSPEGVELPLIYDLESGQPWTRSRERYLRHERAIAERHSRVD